MRTLLTTLLLALTLTACSQGTGSEDVETASLDPDSAVVTVAFRDSSVPPEYHRSWRLTLDSDEIAVVVDSYGDVVSEGSDAMSSDQWRDFVADLPADVAALPEPAAEEPGCSGGTGISLTVEGSWSTEIDVDNCADPANQEITDRVIALVEPFADAVGLEERTSTD